MRSVSSDQVCTKAFLFFALVLVLSYPLLLFFCMYLRQMLAMQKDEIEAIISEVDTDGDGEIDFEEFMVMIRSNKTSALGAAAEAHPPHPSSPQHKGESDLGLGVVL
eukprot:gene408-766_t